MRAAGERMRGRREGAPAGEKLGGRREGRAAGERRSARTSHGTPKTRVHTELRATGSVSRPMTALFSWPITRALSSFALSSSRAVPFHTGRYQYQ